MEIRRAYNNDNASQNDIQYIEINLELMLEINNLCCFNEAVKVKRLLKYMQYMDRIGGSTICVNCIRFGYLQPKIDELQCNNGDKFPTGLISFSWEDDGVMHTTCYLQISDSDCLKDFQIDTSRMKDNDCYDYEFGWGYWVSRTPKLLSLVSSNCDLDNYKIVFARSGDFVQCYNPGLIKHKYPLRPLTPCHDFCYDKKESNIYNKYYDLYHCGNWNAKHAIIRGGCCLD